MSSGNGKAAAPLPALRRPVGSALFAGAGRVVDVTPTVFYAVDRTPSGSIGVAIGEPSTDGRHRSGFRRLAYMVLTHDEAVELELALRRARGEES